MPGTDRTNLYLYIYSTQVLLCLFPGMLWLWHFLYSVGSHPVSSLHIYTFVVSRAFTAGAASQAGDADSSRAPGLTSGLQGSVNDHRGSLLLVPQWQCISSFIFYIIPLLFRRRFWSFSIGLEEGHIRYMTDFPRAYMQKVYKRKRKRSDSVLWQKPLHPQKNLNSSVTT